MSDGGPGPALLASLRIHYQPIIRLADGRTDHAEVLVRAMDRNGILHGPEDIVTAMSENGQALPLTLAIMRRALADYRAYNFCSENLALAFNLPLDAMLHPELLGEINALCLATNLPPGRIRFELTETSPVQNLTAAARSITALHKAGHLLALDDITPATPYLDALMNLPISAIKFSNTLTTNPNALNFIQTMTKRATANGQESIAEGIETPAQLTVMQNAGATHAQGYLFSHPLPAHALAPLLCGAA